VKLSTVVMATVCLALGGSAAAAKSKKVRRTHQPQQDDGADSQRCVDPQVEGRNRLKKANALAGEGDCPAAIDQYSVAYDMLNDPVVLFNRAECYRRTGDHANAVADYRVFLYRMPKARNRADIEAKIAALERPAPPPSSTYETAAPPPYTDAAVAAAPAPAAAAAKPAAPAHVERRWVETGGAASEADSRSPWWAWGGLGALVVGGVVAGVVMFRPQEAPPPDSTWGNYRF
jgi:hypothetical protein